jgi:UDP-glucose 4-epimerase
MHYLVTGGAGFIGSHLVDWLVGLGHDVVVVDDFSTGRGENLAAHAGNGRLTVHRRSITDDLDDLFRGSLFAAVFHLAALPRVQFSIQRPRETHDVNVNGTLNLLEACRRFGVKRFVYSSSSSVYGDQDRLPLVEGMAPNPMSPYALHKLIGEHYARLYHRLFGLETVSLRYFNVYGPRQNPEGDYACLIPKFIALLSRGERPVINGDGEQSRDFTYVGDVVEANLLAASTTNPACFGEAFNIGAGQDRSVNQVTAEIVRLTGAQVQPTHGPAVVEPRHTRADMRKAKQLLCWEPQTAFAEGLRNLIRVGP